MSFDRPGEGTIRPPDPEDLPDRPGGSSLEKEDPSAGLPVVSKKDVGGDFVSSPRPEPLDRLGDDDSGSVGHLTRIRQGAIDVTERLAEYRNYGAGDRVPPENAIELEESFQEQISALQEFLKRSEVEQSEFVRQIEGRLQGLQAEVEELRQRQEPPPWSLFDSIGHALLRMTVGAVLGGILGAPVMSYLLHEPVAGRLIEGVVGGVVGGLASDIADPLDRSTARPTLDRPPESSSPTRTRGPSGMPEVGFTLDDLEATGIPEDEDGPATGKSL